MALMPLGSGFASTREVLHAVAVQIVARARVSATGRFGLRVTPGGFGTPDFGDGPSRVRVSGSTLIVESGKAGAASSRALPMHGASLDAMAAFAAVDLTQPINVGHDEVVVPDSHAGLHVDDEAAEDIAVWYDLIARALDRIVALDAGRGAPSVVQLWPEHFDVACDIAYDATDPAQRRVNLGGSPGDGFESLPYAYIGPWTSDRPGAADFWNAPFGAVLRYAEVAAAPDPLGALTDFYLDGLHRLRG